jgi:hypothetical protein
MTTIVRRALLFEQNAEIFSFAFPAAVHLLCTGKEDQDGISRARDSLRWFEF